MDMSRLLLPTAPPPTASPLLAPSCSSSTSHQMAAALTPPAEQMHVHETRSPMETEGGLDSPLTSKGHGPSGVPQEHTPPNSSPAHVEDSPPTVMPPDVAGGSEEYEDENAPAWDWSALDPTCSPPPPTAAHAINSTQLRPFIPLPQSARETRQPEQLTTTADMESDDDDIVVSRTRAAPERDEGAAHAITRRHVQKPTTPPTEVEERTSVESPPRSHIIKLKFRSPENIERFRELPGCPPPSGIPTPPESQESSTDEPVPHTPLPRAKQPKRVIDFYGRERNTRRRATKAYREAPTPKKTQPRKTRSITAPAPDPAPAPEVEPEAETPVEPVVATPAPLKKGPGRPRKASKITKTPGKPAKTPAKRSKATKAPVELVEEATEAVAVGATEPPEATVTPEFPAVQVPTMPTVEVPATPAVETPQLRTSTRLRKRAANDEKGPEEKRQKTATGRAKPKSRQPNAVPTPEPTPAVENLALQPAAPVPATESAVKTPVLGPVAPVVSDQDMPDVVVRDAPALPVASTTQLQRRAPLIQSIIAPPPSQKPTLAPPPDRSAQPKSVAFLQSKESTARQSMPPATDALQTPQQQHAAPRPVSAIPSALPRPDAHSAVSVPAHEPPPLLCPSSPFSSTRQPPTSNYAAPSPVAQPLATNSASRSFQQRYEPVMASHVSPCPRQEPSTTHRMSSYTSQHPPALFAPVRSFTPSRKPSYPMPPTSGGIFSSSRLSENFLEVRQSPAPGPVQSPGRPRQWQSQLASSMPNHTEPARYMQPMHQFGPPRTYSDEQAMLRQVQQSLQQKARDLEFREHMLRTQQPPFAERQLPPLEQRLVQESRQPQVVRQPPLQRQPLGDRLQPLQDLQPRPLDKQPARDEQQALQIPQKRVEQRPARDEEKDLEFVQELCKVLEVRSKAKADMGKRQAARILQLLQLAKYPSKDEALFLTAEEAAEKVQPGVFWNGPIITEGQQIIPLQTVEQFLGEYYEPDAKVWIQDPCVRPSLNAPITRQVTMQQVKERLLSGEGTDKPWNLLELATHCDDGLRPVFLNTEDARLLTKLKIPESSDHARRRVYGEGYKEVEKWALVAQAGALTEPHQDSHGYSTFITINAGPVGFGWLSHPTPVERKAWCRSPSHFTGGRWRYVVLKAGQTVYFPAGTVHFVFRSPDAGNTLAFGGHILRCSNIVHWVKTMLEERDSKEITNEDLTDSSTGYLNRVEKFVKHAKVTGTMHKWGGEEAIGEFLKLKKDFARRKQK